ncbi:hypothetical protein [Methylorubrum extorquens]|uniref:hypothetical protein n=1 Tax=Methylorubrum extorquens TaxID=408 RepID=UPI001FCC853E|nr:hypothetical protein [Methylorubrum extorquens]
MIQRLPRDLLQRPFHVHLRSDAFTQDAGPKVEVPDEDVVSHWHVTIDVGAIEWGGRFDPCLAAEFEIWDLAECLLVNHAGTSARFV